MKILAMIVDYKSTDDARHLSVQLAKHAALLKSSFDLKIVHVDNGNVPQVQLSDGQKGLAIECLATGGNRGYAGALNFTIQHYQDHAHRSHDINRPNHAQNYDAYWLLNSDLEIEPDCLDHLVQALTENPQVGAVGPLVYVFKKQNQIWGARGKVSPLSGLTAMTDWKPGGRLPKWSYLPGCTVLIRATAYDQAGGLPEHYQLYFEETEFCIRLQRLGWDLWVARDAIAHHRVDSLKAGIPARHFAYYFIRNNLLFWKNSFGIPIWLQFPRMIYVACREVILPLRRARNWADVGDRLKYLGAGIVDGVLLALNRPLKFENKLFK